MERRGLKARVEDIAHGQDFDTRADGARLLQAHLA